ncbi:hypothetical protein [Mesorhizobium tamadayense]|uniref:hypothetical protein n=1 Tax=Mesorhizobium tamadayense TaxID=425306 RepID=UPI003CCB237F
MVVSNELRSGLLVKAHPLSLPGYGFYLVSMAHSPRMPAIEAFSSCLSSHVLQMEELGLQIAPLRQRKPRAVAAFRLDLGPAKTSPYACPAHPPCRLL